MRRQRQWCRRDPRVRPATNIRMPRLHIMDNTDTYKDKRDVSNNLGTERVIIERLYNNDENREASHFNECKFDLARCGRCGEEWEYWIYFAHFQDATHEVLSGSSTSHTAKLPTSGHTSTTPVTILLVITRTIVSDHWERLCATNGAEEARRWSRMDGWREGAMEGRTSASTSCVVHAVAMLPLFLWTCVLLRPNFIETVSARRTEWWQNKANTNE